MHSFLHLYEYNRYLEKEASTVTESTKSTTDCAEKKSDNSDNSPSNPAKSNQSPDNQQQTDNVNTVTAVLNHLFRNTQPSPRVELVNNHLSFFSSPACTSVPVDSYARPLITLTE